MKRGKTNKYYVTLGHTFPYAEGIGWLGMVAILVAFAAVSNDRLSVHHTSYQVLNIVGGFALAYSSVSKRAYPAAMLNTAFAAVAITALIQAVWRN